MLLNKIKVLDKGCVSLVSSCNSSVRLKDLKNEFFKAQLQPDFLKIASVTLYIKCPLFIQLQLSKFGLIMMSVPPTEDTVDSYVPDETEIGSPDREANTTISDDMRRTTDALLINPKAYQADGCNIFISQVMTPINIYTELIVHGTLEQWLTYLYSENNNLPRPAEAYLATIENILLAEWYNLKELKELMIKRFQNEKV